MYETWLAKSASWKVEKKPTRFLPKVRIFMSLTQNTPWEYIWEYLLPRIQYKFDNLSITEMLTEVLDTILNDRLIFESQFSAWIKRKL